MPDFRTALTTARPLYVDGTMKVNFTVAELCQFVEDYLKDNQPIVTVEMHEPKCGHRFTQHQDGSLKCIYCGIIKTLSFDEPVNHTQDNHFHTKG